jgi:hypothetical protein
MMKKAFSILIFILSVFFLTGCSVEAVTCGPGTIIKDGKCTAPDPDDNSNGNTLLNCDSIEGTIFYEANFNQLQSVFVDNEAGNTHNANNFVIWGKISGVPVLNNVEVENGSLVISGLEGSQLDPYYDTGLGYQFFNFETDVTYTVCTIIEGPSGQYLTSELGIYYGNGVRDDVLMNGEKQVIVQSFKPTLTTNVDFGQYVLFTGNIAGKFTVYSIKIIIKE